MTGTVEQRKLVLLAKIAERVSADAILKLATENLSAADIQEMQKEAVGPNAVPGMAALEGALGGAKAIGGVAQKAVGHTLDPSFMTEQLFGPGGPRTAPSALTRALEGAKGVGRQALQQGAEHPLLGAGMGAAAVASPFVLKWLYDRLTGPDTAQQEQKLSSAGFTPQVRAELEKVAHDPEVALAVIILGHRGLLG